MGKKGYKAFEKGMVCQGKEYKENTTYKENGNKICKLGVMHYCENPFDVLDYYPLIDDNGDFSEFAEVESLGNDFKEGNRSASDKLYIGAKLSFKNFIKACIDFTLEKTKIDQKTIINIKDYYARINSSEDDAKISSFGYYDQIDSSGDFAQVNSFGNYAQIGLSGNYINVGSSGEYAQISSSGGSTKIGSSGDSTQISSSGNFVQIGSSGDLTQIGSSGYFVRIGSSGYFTKIGSSGNQARINSLGSRTKIGSSGDNAKISSFGENSVICCAGCDSIARAKKGSWITLSEWRFSKEKGDVIPVCVKTEYVDGENIKENTFYELINGKFQEVEVEDAEMNN